MQENNKYTEEVVRNEEAVQQLISEKIYTGTPEDKKKTLSFFEDIGDIAGEAIDVAFSAVSTSAETACDIGSGALECIGEILSGLAD